MTDLELKKGLHRNPFHPNNKISFEAILLLILTLIKTTMFIINQIFVYKL